MGSSLEDSDISYSEIDDHEAKSYSCLKDGELKVKYSDSSYRCPFCAGKEQDYRYKDLLQHATALCQSNRGAKVKANHRALANLLKNDLSNADGLSQTVIEQEAHNPKKEDHFVWPWMGILVSASIINRDGRFVGESVTKMKEDLHQFNPLKVHALWSVNGHSRKFIVDFSKDWAGFNNAMAFEKFFEAKHLGKRDWNERRHYGSNMYGWVARDDDYHSRCLIGDHLRLNGDLTTITDLEKKESRKMGIFFSTLDDEIEVKNKKIKELEKELDIMPQAHNEELREVRRRSRDISLRIIEKVMLEMERKLNDNKKKLASFEQKKADGNVSMLVEEEKGEKDDLLKRMRELERQEVADKQEVELEIELMKGLLQFMAHQMEEMDFLKDSHQTLIFEEGLSNDELEDVFKALITGIQNVCKRRYHLKAEESSSKWKEEVKKLEWNPFKRRKVDEKDTEVIDFKDELGDEVYMDVITTLLELEFSEYVQSEP